MDAIADMQARVERDAKKHTCLEESNAALRRKFAELKPQKAEFEEVHERIWRISEQRNVGMIDESELDSSSNSSGDPPRESFFPEGGGLSATGC